MNISQLHQISKIDKIINLDIQDLDCVILSNGTNNQFSPDEIMDIAKTCPVSWQEFYDRYFYEGSIRYVDALSLYTLVKAFKPVNILEIGSFVGTSSKFLSMAIQENGIGHITSVDILPLNISEKWIIDFTFGIGRCGLLNEEDRKYFTFIVDTGENFVKTTNQHFDFLFEDSAHTYDTTNEIIKYLPKVLIPNSIMVHHDAAMVGIQQAFKERGLSPILTKYYLSILQLK